MAPGNPMPRTSRVGSVSGKALRYHHPFPLPVYLLLLCVSAATVLAQSPLQQAVALTRQGQYAAARKVLQGIPPPASTPQLIAFHRLRAAIASGLAEPDGAAQEMEQALHLAPADSNLLRATAVAEFIGGRLDAALLHARATAPDAAREELIGDIQDRRQDFAAALTAYRSAVTLAPDQENYRLALALELIRRQQYDPAVQALKNAAQTFPRSSKINTLLGIAEYAQGYSEEAVLALQNAIAADPQDHAACAALAKIVLQSSAAPAPQTVAALCAWNPLVCSALRLREAREHGDQQMFTAAANALKLSPLTDVVGRCELARAYEWQNNLPAARTELERCVQLQPTPQNHYRLGLLYRRLGLAALSRQQMALRRQLLESMSEQTALGLDSLAATSVARP